MKVAISNTTNEARSILDHSNGEVTDGLRADSEAVLVDNPINNPDVDLPVGNTCTAVQSFFLRPELREQLLSDLGVKGGKAASVLYTVFNGEKFGDWIEVVPNLRFMNGNVGPRVLWGNATALKVDRDIETSIPLLSKIRETLAQMEYRGEFYAEIAEDSSIVTFSFGHFYAYFAMYAEMSKHSVDQIMEFIFGKTTDCKINDVFCVSNLVSSQPFPLILQNEAAVLKVPLKARNHAWYLDINGLVEVVLLTIVGAHLNEARYRMKITLRNMKNYNSDIQYRTDYGLYARFVLSAKKYEKLCKPRGEDRRPIPQTKLATSRQRPQS